MLCRGVVVGGVPSLSLSLLTKYISKAWLGRCKQCVGVAEMQKSDLKSVKNNKENLLLQSNA